jgi:hypothetical protein
VRIPKIVATIAAPALLIVVTIVTSIRKNDQYVMITITQTKIALLNNFCSLAKQLKNFFNVSILDLTFYSLNGRLGAVYGPLYRVTP